MKKLYPTTTLIALSMLSASLFADDEYATDQNNNNKMQRSQNRQMARPCCTYPTYDFMITADYLYWKAEEDNIEYATKIVNSGGTMGSNNSQNIKAYDLDMKGKWKSGFRAGIGGFFGKHDELDVRLEYTWFYDKTKHSSHRDANSELIPMWSNVLGPTATSAKAEWAVHLNVLDLEFGRNYSPSKKLVVRPHLGLRGVIIDQDYNAHYDSIASFRVFNSSGGSMDNSLSGFSKIRTDLDYKTVGVRTGVDLFWQFVRNWGFYGKVSVALLYGKFDLDETMTGSLPSISGTSLATVMPELTPFKIKFDDNFWRVRANVDTAIGIRYSTGICDDSYRFTLSAGYELSEWFQQNEMIEFHFSTDGAAVDVAEQDDIGPGVVPNNTNVVIDRKEGNLAFQGLTVSAAFAF